MKMKCKGCLYLFILFLKGNKLSLAEVLSRTD